MSELANARRERVTEILCRHFVVDGLAGLDDNYNAAYHTISAETMYEVVTEVLDELAGDGTAVEEEP